MDMSKAHVSNPTTIGIGNENYKAHLNTKKLKRLSEASTSSMFMSGINLSTNQDYWVLDTGYGSHIYKICKV